MKKFRSPDDVLEQLASFMKDSEEEDTSVMNSDNRKNILENEDDLCVVRRSVASFINQHIRRTIGFALSTPAVTYKTKRMLQLVRHEFSRERNTFFSTSANERISSEPTFIEDYAAVVNEVHAEKAKTEKSNLNMDKHLQSVMKKVDKLYFSKKGQNNPQKVVKPQSRAVAEKLYHAMNQRIQKQEQMTEDTNDEI